MRIVFAAPLVLLAACASPFGASDRRYVGVYSEGLETMTFRADERDEEWSVKGAFYALQAAAPPRADPTDGFSVCATVVGRLSPPGRYGHLGLFRRELEVVNVVEARPPPCG